VNVGNAHMKAGAACWALRCTCTDFASLGCARHSFVRQTLIIAWNRR
jgi:hypothetical protein